MSVMDSDDGRRGRGGQGVAQLRRHGATASGAGRDTREERRAHDHRSRREAGPRRLLEQQVGVAVRLAETAEEILRRAGDDRVYGQRHEAQAGRQPVQHHVEAAGLRLVLGELPGRLFLDQTVEAPWKLAKDEAQAGRLDMVLHGLAAGLRLVALAIHPVIPGTAEEILRRLGQPHGDADLLLEKATWTGLTPAAVVVGAPLFPRIAAGA